MKVYLPSRSRNTTNWANPIDCPTIFEAKGAAIKSGNWQSCTAINTAEYVIKNYLGGKVTKYMDGLTNTEKFKFWQLVEQIEKYNNWDSVPTVVSLCNEANELIRKLPILK